jgi:sirohydrochlorin cobaltochelatase
MMSKKKIGLSHFGQVMPGMLLALGLVITSPPVSAEEDHSQHQGHQHQLTQEQFAELREKIEIYRGFTDQQIIDSMSHMRNHGGMISDEGVVGDVGILALAHGYKPEANKQWMEKFESVSREYPTGYGLGMAMMSADHIQSAIDGLEAAGAKTILVLRTETGDTNSLNYQWQYIFSRRDEAAYLTIPRVKTSAKIIWGPSPTAHPIMGEIMLDHALELSTDPANEMVIILGHGAMTPKENEMDLAIMAKHAEAIKKGGGFREVKRWNVQDDLPADQRAANVDKIHGWISAAQDQGMDVIVVTNVLTQSGVMRRLQKDVSGTGAKFSDQGLMQSPRFSDWINSAVEENIS